VEVSKYIFQLRRGTRYVDENGATLLNPDGTPVRDDWATYTAQENHLNPLDGELVVEFEYNPTTGKKTPRFKLGYDDNIFANLEYISPDSFILPKPISVTLPVDKWVQVVDENNNLVVDTYSQVVTVTNAIITEHSRVDLQPTLEQLAEFYDLGIALTTENNNKIVTVYSVGVKPVKDYTIPATITEIIMEDEVSGNE
jgi:hypothetical protein